MIIYFTWDGFVEVNVMKIVNENVVQHIVAHGVKVDRLSRVLGKIFLKCIILAAYRCIEEDNFDCKL